MIDAFVAMGGNVDTSGHVNAELLIEIIKKEFELTIDIEGLIKEVDTDNSGKIEFDEFKELLKTNYLQDNEDYPWYQYNYIILINEFNWGWYWIMPKGF